jgi:hypothetical protein
MFALVSPLQVAPAEDNTEQTKRRIQMHSPHLFVVRFDDRRRQNIGNHQHQNQEKGQEIKTEYCAVGRD